MIDTLHFECWIGWLCCYSLPFDTLSYTRESFKGRAAVRVRPSSRRALQEFLSDFSLSRPSATAGERAGGRELPAREKEVAAVRRRRRRQWYRSRGGEERGTARQPSNSTATANPSILRSRPFGQSVSPSLSLSLSLSLAVSLSLFPQSCLKPSKLRFPVRRRRRRSRLKSTPPPPPPHSEIYRCVPLLSSPLGSWSWRTECADDDGWSDGRTGGDVAWRRRLLLSSVRGGIQICHFL